jgi:hypothetical protein
MSTPKTGPACSSFYGTESSDSIEASTTLAKRRWSEPETVSAAMRGRWVWVWEVRTVSM